MGFSLVAESGDYSPAVVCDLLMAVAPPVLSTGSRSHGLQSPWLLSKGSAAVAHWLS